MAPKLITICLALGLALASGTEAAAASQSARQADGIAPAAVGLVARGAGSGMPGGSDDVRAIQSRLRELGFRPGPVDGLFGPRTEQAVLAFQQRHGISVDGIVGPQTRTHLRYHADLTRPFAGLGSGYSRPGGSGLVREVQRRLRSTGFRPGPVDGLFGPRTERAVRAFQESRDLDPDGTVRGETLRRLRGNVAQQTSSDIAPAPGAGESSASTAQDAPQAEATRTPAPTGGSADDSADAPALSWLVVGLLAGALVILALLLVPGVAARVVAIGWLLRSKGLASGPSPSPSTRGDARESGRKPTHPPTGSGPRNGAHGMQWAGPARPALTDRELAVLRLAAEGFTNAQIGARLYLSRHTVKEHLSHAMRKLGATNRLRAINEASSLGLLIENGLGTRSRGDPAAKFAYEDFANGEKAPDLGAPLGTKEER
jgi:peptidoglycan hydrolase-like protein with peptidoglycan-binding domain